MTEAEWLLCTDPTPMLDFISNQPSWSQLSSRKARLFACACCRHVWDQLLSPLAKHTVEATERLADAVTEGSYILDNDLPFDLWSLMKEEGGWQQNKIARGLYLVVRDGWSQAREVAWETSSLAPRRRERQYQTALLRCITGRLLFRPILVDPAWLIWKSGTIPTIAKAIYGDKAFGDLSVLADALEDAGCVDADLLAHCRESGPHVRGCWAVDMLLGSTLSE